MTRYLMFEMDDWQTLFRNDGTDIVRVFDHHRIEKGALLQEASKHYPFEYRSFFYDGNDTIVGEMWGDHQETTRSGETYWVIWDVPKTMEQSLFDYIWEQAYAWV